MFRIPFNLSLSRFFRVRRYKICNKGEQMAKIIENKKGRRTIYVSTDDIINLVREYQMIVYNKSSYEEIRKALDSVSLYLPEEI